MVHRAQLRQHAKNKSHRCYQESLEILLDAEKECNKLLGDITSEIDAHAAKGEVLKKEHAALNVKPPEKRLIVRSAKGKEREVSETPSDLDVFDDDLPKTAAGNEHRNKRVALRQRARDVRIVLHRVKFLQGDVYNVLGESFAAEEAAAYSVCEELRRELLKGKLSLIRLLFCDDPLRLIVTAEDANSGMAELDNDATKHGVDADTLMVEVPYLEDGGLRSVRLVRAEFTFVLPALMVL